jgi:hypothetical protein
MVVRLFLGCIDSVGNEKLDDVSLPLFARLFYRPYMRLGGVSIFRFRHCEAQGGVGGQLNRRRQTPRLPSGVYARMGARIDTPSPVIARPQGRGDLGIAALRSGQAKPRDCRASLAMTGGCARNDVVWVHAAGLPAPSFRTKEQGEAFID